MCQLLLGYVSEQKRHNFMPQDIRSQSYKLIIEILCPLNVFTPLTKSKNSATFLITLNCFKSDKKQI